MKRILRTTLAFVFLLALFSVPVLADDVYVSDEQALTQALYDGGTVILDGDVALTTYVDILADVTLDLNGHSILVAESAHSASIMNRVGNRVVIRDSVGTGRIGDGEKWLSVNNESGTLIIEGGSLAAVSVSGGTAELTGGNIAEVSFSSVHSHATVTKGDGAQVDTWSCETGTVNIDPTAYLKTGYAATKNQDGTYTIYTVTVEKSGKTITFYYDCYSEARGEYALTHTGEAPEALALEILSVNDGLPEIIPMKKCDDQGRLWYAKIDTAYFGTQMYITNDADGIATYLMDVPTENNAKFTADGQWSILPQSEDSPWWLWVIVGAAVIAVAAVVTIVVKKKKK